MPKHKNDPQLLAAIGARLQAAREARGLTQAELAEVIGIEAVTLSRYETGARGPSITTLRDAAVALGVRLQDVVGDEGEPLPVPEHSPAVARAVRLLDDMDDHHRDLAVRVLNEIGKSSP